MRDHQTGCFVADSYQMSFSVKANTGAAFVSFHANVNGPDLPLAYSFSLLAAGMHNPKAPNSNTEYRRIPAPNHASDPDFSHVLIGFRD